MNPYDNLPHVAAFSVVSKDIKDKEIVPQPFVGQSHGGKDVSPQLSWSGFPSETKSFAVTVYDPDAPTGSGFWHWLVVNIPPTTTELSQGAGDQSGSKLPAGAKHHKNDNGLFNYIGPAPPRGHGKHRYFFVVHALNTETLDLPSDASPAMVAFNLTSHSLGRGILQAWYEA